jgi:hypothetical protein
MKEIIAGLAGSFILAVSLSACVVAPPQRPVAYYRPAPAVVYAPPPRPYYPPPPRPYYPPRPRPYYPPPGVSVGIHVN